MKTDFKRFKNLKTIVEYALQTYPELRDSDKALTIKIRRYLVGKNVISLEEIYYLPSQDNIKRARARFNQQGLYLSENPDVLKRRMSYQKVMRQDLGYNS